MAESVIVLFKTEVIRRPVAPVSQPTDKVVGGGLKMAVRTLLFLAVLAAVPAAALKSPPAPTKVAAGAKLYAQYCAMCHGKTGRGDGAVGASLKPKPRSFREPKLLKSRTDEDLFKVISKGGPALGLSPTMVGWGGILKEPQVREVVAFVRSMVDSSSAAKADGDSVAARSKGKP